MKKYFAFLCCIVFLLSFHSRLSAAEHEDSEPPYKYGGKQIIKANELDMKTIMSHVPNKDDLERRKIPIKHPVPFGEKRYRELKLEAEQPNMNENQDDNEMSDEAINHNAKNSYETDAILPLSYPGHSYGNSPVPDPTIAVSTSHVVLAVNHYLAYYDKTNGMLVSTPTDFNNFSGIFDKMIFDPWVVYDKSSGRFFFVAGAKSIAPPNSANILLYVSKSANPMDGWCPYKIETTTEFFFDYPKVGFDANGVYITADMASFDPESFVYSSVYSFPKSPLINCQDATSQHFYDLRNNDNSRARAIQPALNYENLGSTYLINGQVPYNNYPWNGLTLWEIYKYAPQATVLARYTKIPVTSYSLPPDAVQKDSTTKVDTGDGRLLNAAFRDGYIWTTHTVKSTAYNVSAVRVYRVNTATYTAGISHQFHSSGIYSYNASVMPGANGNVAIVYNRSSSTEYPGIRYGKRISGTWQATQQLVTEYEGGYFSGYYDLRFGGYRWGDYAGSSPDPDDVNKIWLYNEYSKSDHEWATEFFSVQLQ